MRLRLNPFHENFATETTSPGDFVRLFSPEPLQLSTDVLSLFSTGNVVLTGVQGCGKSMLLALLSPDIRIAYHTNQVEFPVSNQQSQFISAGINLTVSTAPEFGQRSIESNSELDKQWPLYFGDFVNYWIVRDLIATLERFSRPDAKSIAQGLGLRITADSLDRFAVEVAHHECWSGYLDPVRSFEDLRQIIGQRLRTYREYLNYNCVMPEALSASKTTAGEPISVVAEMLRQCGVIGGNTNVYVRIDQYEELTHLEDWSRKKGLFHDYRSIIHKMLGRRDGRVHYRIGTRRYAWPGSPQMYSTSAVAENLRNYTVIDLDELLRRKENIPWVFPKFAEDVFRRRLTLAGFRDASIRDILGNPLSAEEKAKRYAKNSPERVVDCEQNWPTGCCDVLQQIASSDPLSAKLGEAYLRQNLDRNQLVTAADLSSSPWNSSEKKYWRKDRVDQALLQIAASRRQKMLWSGDSEILGLAAGNILAFLDLCKAIWATWLRSASEDSSRDDASPPQIQNEYMQNEGVQHVSTHWFEKIRGEERGDSRMRFARYVGEMFRGLVRDDRKMSYPGYIGFSLPASELESDSTVRKFLEDATAFGVLMCKRHTPRSKGRGDSHKWYLHPILCPYFQLPLAHRKEPKEVHTLEIRGWLEEAGVILKSDKPPNAKSLDSQPTLFDLEVQD